MSKNHKNDRQDKKRALLTPKENKAAKKHNRDSKAFTSLPGR